MMETQKILKPAEKIVIISDYREREVIDKLKNLGVRINEMDLEVADFIASDRVAIERKTHSDFVSSIIDGRIFDQAKSLRENFEKRILIIEGSSNREINENILKSTVAKLVTDGMSMINTKNPLDTAKTIYWIAKKEQQEQGLGLSFKVGKKTKSKKKLQEQIVASLPGVSSVISKRLLEYFGSIEKVFTANEEELMKVKGVGKSLAQKIKNMTSEKY